MPAPVGEPVAEYVVRYADGGEAHLPIRERFEIAAVPNPWGQAPLLAWPDGDDELLPRNEGPWEHAGRRQTEDLMADVEQLLGRRGKRTQQGAERVVREVERAKRATGHGGSFPISNYDDLAAAQITSRLDDLSPAQLRKVRDYERRHGNRKTVLSAIERKLG